MKKERDFEGLVVAALFGGATPEEREELQSALADDPARRDEFAALQETMQTVSRMTVARDPGKQYWDSIWPDFENRLLAEEMKNRQPVERSAWWTQFWRPALQVSLVGLMLVLGIFIGKQLSSQESVPGLEAENAGGTLSLPYEQEINRQKQDYMMNVAERSLTRSSQVLDRFMQIQPDNVEGDSRLISSQRDEIVSLLDEISQLRNNVSDPRIQEFSPLLDELDILMGDIAGIRGDSGDIRYQISMLQQGISQRNLLDRLQRARGLTLVRDGGVNQ